MNKIIRISGLIGLAFACASVSSAQPYYLAGDFLNGWDPGANPMNGGPNVYNDVVTGGSPGTYENVKVTVGNWGASWPANNVMVKFDSTGQNTIYFFPGFYTDGWQPVGNRIGYADPGDMAWEVTGDFTSPAWGSDPGAQLVSAGNGVYTNIYVISNPGTYGFKFRTPGTWDEVNFGVDFGNGSANATIATTNVNQAVLFVLDLPNGRWFVGTPGVPFVTNQVVFAVDMTAHIQAGLFHPGYSVFVSGTLNNWPGPSPGALVLTNYPPYGGGSNTNIYYATNSFAGQPGWDAADYKFADNDPALPASYNGYELLSTNRSVYLLASNGTNVLPVVSFGNLYASDILTADTPVFFSVDMTGAVGTDGHVFDSNVDNVYINGQFANWYPWEGFADPAFQMVEEGATLIYTNIIIIPAGAPISLAYKYGMDIYPFYPGPADDEAGFEQNHSRVLRSTALTPYMMPTDTFGNMYSEPFFGNYNTVGGKLTVGQAAGGTVPVTWLGRPGAHLQVKNSLISGVWQDVWATDGTNWTSGFNSVNGFVSKTNWPVTGQPTFFRLVKP